MTTTAGTEYPNREHKNADAAARRRALAALAHIADEAANFRQRIEGGHPVDGDDTHRFASLACDLTQHISILATLRDVREWHAADKAESEAGR